MKLEEKLEGIELKKGTKARDKGYPKKFKDCSHDNWQYYDPDEMGECPDCGAMCVWHYEKDVFDNYPDYIGESYQPVADRWFAPDNLEWDDYNCRYVPILGGRRR